MGSSHILIVMVVAIALTIFAERRSIQPALFLAAVGLVVSFIPALPRTELDPEILLAVVVPPLIYSTATEFSIFSFVRRLHSILNLGVALVVVTALAGGVAVGAMLPSLGLPAALILGAVVAPPDAVSAVAIGGQLGLPRRLMTIMTGESLINDAAALTLFSLAVAATMGTHTFISSPWLYFLYASLVGVVIGLVLARIVHRVRSRLANPTMVTALAVLVPFAAYGLAEEVHASGVMAVVAAGFSLGHNSAGLNFAGRIREREVWRVVTALLEAFVFAYMGLQFRFVLSDAEASGFAVPDLLLAALALLAVVIIIRFVWIFGTGALAAWRYRRWVAAGRPRPRRSRGEPAEPLSWRENLVLSWAGMRGVVTLAAAAGTPAAVAIGNGPAPRDAIVPIAFLVAIGTLLLQGLTLPWLVKLLQLENSDDPSARKGEMVNARKAMREASRKALEEIGDKEAQPAQVRAIERLLARAREVDPENAATEARSTLELARRVLAAQRQALIAERDAGRIDDEVVRELLESLDLEEAVVASRGARVSS